MSSDLADDKVQRAPRHKRCETCTAFKPFQTSSFGQCRASPPQRFFNQQRMHFVTLWPDVGPNDWCRQWEEKGPE